MELLGKEDVTISSRKIAEMTNKNHQHVCRDIRNLCEQLEISLSRFGHTYLNSRNQEQTEYLLDKKHALCLATGYDVKRRMQILDYVELLEKQLSEAPTLSFEEQVIKTLSMAQEKVKALECKIEEDAPKVKLHALMTECKDGVKGSECAKFLKLPFGNVTLYKFFRAWGWMFKKSTEPTQEAVNQGYMKTTTYTVISTDGSPVVKITPKIMPKALNLILKKLKKEGAISDSHEVVNGNMEVAK